MKRFELFWVPTLFILAVDFSTASLIAYGRARQERESERKTIEAPYTCLHPPGDLPACNFDPESIEEVEQSAKQRRAVESLDAPDLPEVSQQLSSEEEDPREIHTGASTIVYKIEGCMPPRLPFDIPICSSKVMNGRFTEVSRVLPFKFTGDSDQNSGAPFVFPEFDYKKWKTSMKGAWTRPIRDRDVSGKSSSEVANDSEIDTEMRKIPKRKKFEDSEEYESKRGKVTIVRVSGKVAEHGLLPTSFIPKNQVKEDRSGGMNFYNSKTNKMHHSIVQEKRSTEDIEEYDDKKNHYEFPYEQAISYDPEKLLASGLKSKFVNSRKRIGDAEKLLFVSLGSEFPYADAIPFDAAKLQTARHGSEFPYAQAIPYDPKKLEKRKNRGIEMRAIPFYTRRLKAVEETREDDFREVPFDMSMLAAAKLGSTFPYRKGVPEDTSKTLETMKLSNSPSSEEPEKVRVPVRRVDKDNFKFYFLKK